MSVELLLSIVLLAIILGLVMLYNVMSYLREIASHSHESMRHLREGMSCLREVRYNTLPDIYNTLTELHATAKRIPQTAQFPAPVYNTDHMHEGPPSNPEQFVIWQWRSEKWVAVEFPKDADPGSPPDVPGKFDGDSVRTSILDSLR